MGGVMIAAYWALSGIIGLYLAQALDSFKQLDSIS